MSSNAAGNGATFQTGRGAFFKILSFQLSKGFCKIGRGSSTSDSALDYLWLHTVWHPHPLGMGMVAPLLELRHPQALGRPAAAGRLRRGAAFEAATRTLLLGAV